jgi:hypothetical protein
MCKLAQVYYGQCNHEGRYIYFCNDAKDTHRGRQPCKNLELPAPISTIWSHCSEGCCSEAYEMLRRRIFAFDQEAADALTEIGRHGGWWEPGAKKLTAARQRSIALSQQLSDMQNDCDRWCDRDIFLYESPEPGSKNNEPARIIEDRPIPFCLTSDGEIFETPRGEDVSFRMFKTVYLINAELFRKWLPSVQFYDAQSPG